MYVKLLKEKQMKKGLKIAAITVGVIIILMFLLPFAFQGKIADIVKTEGNKILQNHPSHLLRRSSQIGWY